MALTCPHCNTSIRGHIRRCQACGTWTFSTVETCPNCGCTITASENTQQRVPTIQNAKEPQGQSAHRFSRPCPVKPQKKHDKKKQTRYQRILVNLFLMTLLMSAATYGIYKYHLDQQIQMETIKHELAKRIAEDEKANEKKLYQAQQDSTLWTLTLKTKTIEAAREYIATYPEGIFIDEAYMLIEELQRRSISKLERTHISGVVENHLAQIRELFIKSGKRGIKDIQYRMPDTLFISKKYVNRDSLIYSIHGNVKKITVPTSKAKPDTSTIDIFMTLNRHKEIIESNLHTPIKH